MTALKQYDRLETTGLWRESPQAQRRDVLVSFGEASLVISDRNDTALTHWSLSAISRLNPGERPAIFHLDDDSGEELELDDPTMIDAIEKVRRAIDRRRPKTGRVRSYVVLGITAAILALGFFWLPGALTRHTLTVVPEAKRVALGDALLQHITRLSGPACQQSRSTTALARLSRRSVGEDIRQIHVLPNMSRDTLVLPGKLLLISSRLLEDHEDPNAAAGYLLKAALDAEQRNPLENLLHSEGLRPTFQLLTTGEMSDDALERHAETLLASQEIELDSQALLAQFESAKISSTAFAYARDITGETVLPMIEADPYKNAETPPVLSDEDWLSLQAICNDT